MVGGHRLLHRRFVVIVNLRINFIESAEIRSASMVSVKALLQICALTIPLALVVYVFITYLSYAENKSALVLKEDVWIAKEIQLKKALALNAKLKERKNALDDVDGWGLSRFPWPELLELLRAEVPPNIQLKALQARHTLEVLSKNGAVRRLRIIINGRCAGPAAEDEVERFRSRMMTGSTMSELVEDARVAGFREDVEPGAGPDDRAFQIELDLRPRNVHAATAK